MDDYVEVGRRFAEFDPSASSEAEDLWFLYASEYSAPLTWEDLLPCKAAVIIAEGQSGKSEEFRHQAAIQREAGKFAFFCPLESLLGLSLASAVEGGTTDDLSRWLNSDAAGWFFFDAVDEAKIEGPSRFNLAIAKALETIGPHIARAHIFISSRPHAWDANADRIMLSQRLGLPTTEERSQRPRATESGEAFDEGNDKSRTGSVEKTKETATPDLKVFRLAPLTRSQVQQFAQARRVPNVQEFLQAIERANADVFATRPDDLLGLISLWNATRKIENYTKVVENNINRKLLERNPRHEHAAGLSSERVLYGAQQLAVAITLSRKLGLSVPGQTVVPEQAGQCLNPREVLPDWTSTEILELLGRPIFNQAFYGAVRFHHRTAREYLAAQWLAGLLHSRKHRRSVYALLITRPYNIEREVVRPSLQPVAGWLAQWDQGIRERLERIAPTVLLGWGDASALPAALRSRLLQNYAERYAGRRRTPLSLDTRDIQRLADAKLAPTIRDLFVRYPENADLRRLLLKLIQEGGITECADLARSLAFDSTAESYIRSCAIGALAASGSKQDIEDLVKFLVQAASVDRLVVTTLVEIAFPETLKPKDLVNLLLRVNAPNEGNSSGLRYHLNIAAKRLQSESDLKALLSAIERLLSQEPHIDRFCPVSRHNSWLLEFGATLMAQLLEKLPAARTEPAVLSLLRMGQRTDHIREYSGDVRTITASILNEDPELLREMFWQEVKRAKQKGDPTPIVSWHDQRLTFHSFTEGSLGSYLDDVRTNESLADRQLALSVVLSIAANKADRDTILVMARDAVRGEPVLEAALEESVGPREMGAEELKHHEEMRKLDSKMESERLKKEQNRSEGILWLKGHVSSLVIGDHAEEGKLLSNITYLYRQIVGELDRRSRWAISEWHLLEKDYGPEVAKAFRDYCVGYWRRYGPPLRSDPSLSKNSTPTNIIIGLCGLAIDASETDDWVSTLSAAEAERAACYALWEMNGFPAWFSRLSATRFGDIRTLLRMEMEWEFSQPDASHLDYYLLSRLRYHNPDLRRALRSDAIDLLVNSGTQCAHALTAALSAILSVGGALPVEFRQAVLRGSETDVVPLKAAWLAALLCMDAALAFPLLKEWVDSAPDQEVAQERLIPILVHLWGEKEQSFNSDRKSFLDIDTLVGMIRLAHARTGLGSEALGHRSGWVSDQDRAARAVDMAFTELSNQTGRCVYDALIALSSAELPGLPRDSVLHAAERRAEADAELEAWNAKDVVAFRLSAERIPQSINDLFEIACHRLDDIKLNFEEGDESVSSTLQRVDKEPELRRNIAAYLRLLSAGFYNVASEEELANSQQTDIRLHHPLVDCRVPIEIKIADKWSAQQLAEQLNEQLIGDYMRESPCGIFLLLRRGSARFQDKNSWRRPGSRQPLSFQELVEWLERQADELQRSMKGISLKVIGIDLARRRS